MSEWKSFQVKDGASPIAGGLSFTAVPAAAATPAQSATPGATLPEPDEAAAKWGTKVEPVSLDRIETIVAGDGLPHGRGEFIVVTEVEGLRMQVHREPVDCSWMQVEARLTLGQDFTVADVRAAAQQWNQTRLQPTAIPGSDAAEPVMILATRFYVEHGLSDRQLHVLLRRGIGVTVQAARELPELIKACQS